MTEFPSQQAAGLGAYSAEEEAVARECARWGAGCGWGGGGGSDLLMLLMSPMAV